MIIPVLGSIVDLPLYNLSALAEELKATIDIITNRIIKRYFFIMNISFFIFYNKRYTL